MGTDTVLTIGLILIIFSVPAFLSALSDSRSPRAASLCILLACGAIVWALHTKPGGYSFADIPEVVVEQLAKLVR